MPWFPVKQLLACFHLPSVCTLLYASMQVFVSFSSKAAITMLK
jgi:hypothetical protein